MEWFKIDAKKTLTDAKLSELTYEEKGIRIDLMCYIALSKVTNYVYIDENTPKSMKSLAKDLRVSAKKLQKFLEKTTKLGLISVDNKGAIGIKKWSEWQSSYYRRSGRRSSKDDVDERQGLLTKVTARKEEESNVESNTNVTCRSKKLEVRSKKEHISQGKPAKYVISTNIGKIIAGYKIAKGFEKDDREWDKLNWKRNSRSAKLLLDYFKKDWETAVACLEDVSEELDKKGLDWTLETICKRAADWKLKEEKD